MTKILFRFILLVLIIIGLIYGYYWAMQRFANTKESEKIQNIEEIKNIVDQEGVVILSGEIINVDNNYYLQQEDKVMVELKPAAISLISFIGKKVEVTGTFSGNRLVISKIQEL